ncbi:glutathione S-transferase [Hypoxylon argillaceum]|nr:glutathione S-transferase [Hypoxylon argillaceum]
MASPSDLPIVLYHYDVSPYARRLVWYLHLRKIPYSQCIQPRILPRPDLALLGVSYRRIPILSIGRDVYLDTRLILQKLEALYPPSAAHPGLSRPKAEHAALEQLLSTRVIEGDLFKRAVECFPVNAFADPAFLRDRAALYGVDAAKAEAAGTALPLAPEAMRRRRPEALAVVGRWVRWLEEGLLADGRGWILDSASDGSGSGNGSAGPSLADIEAVWVLHWLYRVPGALPAEVLGADATPRVWAWIRRFDSAVKDAARSAAAGVSSLKGEEAARLIAGSAFADREGEVRRADPLVDARGLAKGASVRVWPTDYGSSHKDAGRLVAVDDTEFVIEAEGTFGSVRIHAPREGFTIARDGGSSVVSKI